MTFSFGSRLGLAVVSLACATTVAATAQTPRYIPGIFVSSPHGPLELIAFAELQSNNRLRMVRGTLEDVPTRMPGPGFRVLVALPLWAPVGAFIGTEEMFRDDYAEQRTLPFAVRRLNVSSVEMRIADLEARRRTERLLKAARASEENPAYLFVIVRTEGLTRYYPVRIVVELEQASVRDRESAARIVMAERASCSPPERSDFFAR